MIPEIKVDESKSDWSGRAASRVALANPTKGTVDVTALGKRLAAVEGLTSVRVSTTSMLRDLRFLEFIPNLKSLIVNGAALENVNGIEAFSGNTLKIDTGKNKRRSLESLRGGVIASVSVHYGHSQDLRCIGSLSSTDSLDVYRFPAISFEEISSIRASYVGVHVCKLRHVAHTSASQTLTKLGLFGCTYLESFEGENERLDWVVVDSCRNLDWRSISHLSAVRSLVVVGTKQPIPISAFKALGKIENISLDHCEIDVSAENIASWWPSVTNVTLSGISASKLTELSQRLPAAVLSNGSLALKNSVPA